jgi:RNA polymerase sigma factor (sigma-70 family)
MSVQRAETRVGGDELEEFCRVQYRVLVGALGLYTGDAGAAEELAQEALMRVASSWEDVRACHSPAAWTMRIAMNLARSRFRRLAAARRAATAMGACPSPVVPELADVLAVRSAVRSLPARQRRALVLRYYADLSVRDTALVLRCPEGTVKTLTRQAIAGLRRAGLEVDDRG